MSDPAIPGSLGGVLRELAARIRRLERRSFSSASSAHLGEVRDFARSTLPDRWLECDGAAVSRAVYADLFAIIGTTWGVGDGSTTFNIPDFQGTFLIARGPSDSFAATGGARDAAVVSHTHTGTSATDAHTHSVNPPSTGTTSDSHTHKTNVRPGWLVDRNGDGATGNTALGTSQTPASSTGEFTSDSDSHSHSVNIAAFNSASDTHSHTFTTDSTGSAGTDLNLPPFAAVIRAIYAGI